MATGTAKGRGRRVAAASAALCAALLVLTGAVAQGATSFRYSGKTSQKRRISFTVSGGAVTKLKFTIVDSCPHKKILYVHNSGFPSMPIKQHKFGGTFTAKAPSVASVVISGKVSGKTVSGTLSDRSKNNKTHKFCSGKTRFRLHPK